MSWKQKTPRPVQTRGKVQLQNSTNYGLAGAAGAASAAGAAGVSAAGTAGAGVAGFRGPVSGAAAPEPASAGAAAAGASAAGGPDGLGVVAAGSQPMIMARDNSPMYFFISFFLNFSPSRLRAVSTFSSWTRDIRSQLWSLIQYEYPHQQKFPLSGSLCPDYVKMT